MKATKANIGRAVDQPDAGIRFYLFYGPDEAQSRAFAARLVESLGASRFLVGAGTLKSDPASLADEAGALSLFGGKRVIWIEPASREIEEAVSGLFEAPVTESPVVAIAGALTKTSALLKLAETSPMAIAHAAYAPEGKDAERMVTDVGRRFGLKIDPAIAARLADACSNDQAIVSRELEKLALYIDASPHSPKELHHGAIDDVGTRGADSDFQQLGDFALAGDIEALTDELVRLPSSGNEGIPVLRLIQRRLLMLASARARVERGERVDAVMASLGRALFWKDKAKVQLMIQKWSPEDLATLADRSGKLERSLMFTAAPEREALGEELLAIARKARSL